MQSVRIDEYWRTRRATPRKHKRVVSSKDTAGISCARPTCDFNTFVWLFFIHSFPLITVTVCRLDCIAAVRFVACSSVFVHTAELAIDYPCWCSAASASSYYDYYYTIVSINMGKCQCVALLHYRLYFVLYTFFLHLFLQLRTSHVSSTSKSDVHNIYEVNIMWSIVVHAIFLGVRKSDLLTAYFSFILIYY